MSTPLSLIICKAATCCRGLTGSLLAVLCLSAFQVASSDPLNVTVTNDFLTVSVTATSPIAFGTVAASSITVSASASTVTAGDEIVTYSLSLANPSGWTAVQAAPGADEYCLSAMFSTAAPAVGDFSYANHALAAGAPGPACSASKFGNGTPAESGLSVPATETRNLWFKFQAPSTTTVTTQQTIVVTVTAAAG